MRKSQFKKSHRSRKTYPLKSALKSTGPYNAKRFKSSGRYRNVDLETNLTELLSLLHIDRINKNFSGQMDQFRDRRREELQEVIQSCEKAKAMYYELLFGQSLREAKESGVSEFQSFHWFEVTRHGINDWRMTRLEPRHGPYTPHYHILPTDLITRMVDSLVEPAEVVSLEKVYSEKTNKTVDLQFVHYSNTFIFGTVRSSVDSYADFAGSSRKSPGTGAGTKRDMNRYRARVTMEEEMAFRVQHFYLAYHSDRLKSMIQEHIIRELPQLKNESS